MAKTSSTETTSTFVVGSYVKAPYEDGEFYPARVTSLNKDGTKAKVTFDDDGSITTVSTSELKAIRGRQTKTPSTKKPATKRELPAALKPETVKWPAVVLFGRDANSKVHAAKFNASNLDGVTKAAKKMEGKWFVLSGEAADGLKDFIIGTDKATKKANLPNGKLFDTGSAFAPFAKEEKFEKLSAALGSKAKATKKPVKSAEVIDLASKRKERTSAKPTAKKSPAPKGSKKKA